MKPSAVYLSVAILTGSFPIRGAELSCEKPALSEPDFIAMVGLRATQFKRIPDYGPRCVYEHPDGSTIRIEERTTGVYAKDEFNSKKEEDTSKAQFAMTTLVDVPGLGAGAYRVADAESAVYYVLDRSKTEFFESEVKIQGIKMNANEVAKNLARAIESTFNKTQVSGKGGSSKSDHARHVCDTSLTPEDIARILGLRPDGFVFTLGVDKSCNYHAKSSQYVHKILRFDPREFTSDQEAESIITSLKSSTSRPVADIGSEAGLMASNQLWFVTSSHKWAVTVSYNEVSIRDADQAALSRAAQDKIRDEVARAIDRNLSGEAPAP